VDSRRAGHAVSASCSNPFGSFFFPSPPHPFSFFFFSFFRNDRTKADDQDCNGDRRNLVFLSPFSPLFSSPSFLPFFLSLFFHFSPENRMACSRFDRRNTAPVDSPSAPSLSFLFFFHERQGHGPGCWPCLILLFAPFFPPFFLPPPLFPFSPSFFFFETDQQSLQWPINNTRVGIKDFSVAPPFFPFLFSFSLP